MTITQGETLMTIRPVLDGPEVFDHYMKVWNGSGDAVAAMFAKC